MFNEKKFNQDIIGFNQEIEKRINHTQHLINQAIDFSKTDNLDLTDAQEIALRSDKLQHNLDSFKQTSTHWLALISKSDIDMTPDDKSLMASLAVQATLLYESIIEIMTDLNSQLQKTGEHDAHRQA